MEKSETIKVEVVTIDKPDGTIVELSRDADYVMVLSGSPNITFEMAQKVGRALGEAFGRPIPVLVTEGAVQVVRIPKEDDDAHPGS